MLTAKEQIRIIEKGVHNLVNREELLTNLENSVKTGRPLIVKLGLDPTAPDIHLGHTVVLRKIKQMQDMGHQAVIIIGDFTGKIGDPTGKSKGRTALSEEQVRENATTYCQQIFKILDSEKTRVCFNSEWLSRLTLEEILKLASVTTVARMLERDDFQNRFHNQIPIGIHEFFYPLMQAYDSVWLNADIEIGGTDQTFNILMGRTLQKAMDKEQQIALFMPILEGLDGVEKMSKSLGNYIGIDEPVEIMYKKVMEVPDSLIIRYFELVTDVHPDEIESINENLTKGVNPRDIKLVLAETVTALYYDTEAVEKAKAFYQAAFTEKGIPEHVTELVIDAEGDLLKDIIPQLVSEGYVSSKSEFHRLLAQGGISIEGEKLIPDDLVRVMICNEVIRIGKKKFVKIIK